MMTCWPRPEPMHDSGASNNCADMVISATIRLSAQFFMLQDIPDAIDHAANQPDLAREALRIEMENFSENYHCAGWLMGLEFLLWERVLALSEPDNTHKLPEAYTCKLLAEAAHGWWHWPRDSRAQEFIAMPDWLALYSEHTNHCNRN